jgi:uncharacterized membrane protein YhiD involved in acid resistance
MALGAGIAALMFLILALADRDEWRLMAPVIVGAALISVIGFVGAGLGA